MSIRYALTTFFLLMSMQATAAEVMYVTDVLYLNLRSGPGNEFNALRTLKSGDSLTVVGDTEVSGFVEISTDTGETGWVPARFLDTVPTAESRLEQANTQIKELEQHNSLLGDRIAELERKLQEAKGDLNKTAEVTSLNQSLREEFASAQAEIEQLRDARRIFFSKEGQRGFMLGVGAILLGVLVGRIFRGPSSPSRNIFR